MESTETYNFSKNDNICRLKNILKGEAREAVASLLLTCADPQEIMDALERRFAKPEQIIANELHGLKTLPKITTEGKELPAFACKVQNMVSTITLLKYPSYLDSIELRNAIINKLNPLLKARWYDFAADNCEKDVHPNLVLLARFLTREADRLVTFGSADLFIENHNHAPHYHGKHYNNFTSQTTHCSYCKGEHDLYNCSTFKEISVDDKYKWVIENKLCFKCLKSRHRRELCKIKPCGVNRCRRNHHRLLHKDSGSPISSQINTHIALSPTGNHDHEQPSTSYSCNQNSCNILLKIVPVIIYGPEKSIETFALLDSGSTTTIIDDSIARQIGACGPSTQFYADCIGGLKLKGINVNLVSFKIKGKFCDDIYEIKYAKSLSNLNLFSQEVFSNYLHNYTYLDDILDEITYGNVQPKILIGEDQWHLMESRELREGDRSQPVASRTLLGWTLHGSVYEKTVRRHRINYICASKRDMELDMLVKHHFSLESLGIGKYEHFGAEYDRAIKILNNTTRRLPDGRYEVGLLWRSANILLPNSYNIAFSRLRGIEKKMDKDPEFKRLYTLQINEMIQKGYAEKCKYGSNNNIPNLWYLPHFGVTNVNKPGKLRIVHDAAAQIDGISLNSVLLSGPVLIESLLGILLRFREGEIALTGDIKEMFPQFKIREADRDAQRFLWRGEERHKPPIQYRMTSMIFGAVSSPCTAIYLKNLNAQQFINKFPTAVNVVIKDHYVDDCITSIDGLQEAKQLTYQINKIHEAAKLEMRGWTSNKVEALSLLPSDRCRNNRVHIFKCLGNNNVKTLGVVWNPSLDTFCFDFKFHKLSKNILDGVEMPTKRQLLSFLMSMYDPYGFLSPIIINGRILFQEVWRKNNGWDAKLQGTDGDNWVSFLKNMDVISNFSIPRWYLHMKAPVRRELHTFCDASEQAFSAVCYWRIIYSDGTISISFIIGKGRVSPLKPTTIPRLELQAALMGTRLAQKVIDEVRSVPDVCWYWSDSQIVLSWIYSDISSYKTYVANRVGEILELTSPDSWRWVPGTDNPADDATRFKNIPNLNRWINGPEFILRNSDSWPLNIVKISTEVELKKEVVNINRESIILKPVIPDINRFSQWSRFFRATVYMYKFIRVIFHRLNNRTTVQLPSSSAEECEDVVDSLRSLKSYRTILLTNFSMDVVSREQGLITHVECAQIMIFRYVQIEYFYNEILCISQGQSLAANSKLIRFKLRLDKNNLLRIVTRYGAIQNVSIERQPIVLDSKSKIVQLLVESYHVKYSHANHELIMNEIRQVYWVLGLRSLVRKVVRFCQRCRIQRATPQFPIEGDVPLERLLHHERPFSACGLDYFGPIEIKVARHREKRWVALFTCLTVRAVHIEIVNSLSTDSCIMALRRMFARRGVPKIIMSDNATTFIGARNELGRSWKEVVEDMKRFTDGKGITWRFIPPAAPFMGGCWERLVKAVKTCLRVTLKERTPTEDVLSTLLLEAEGIVNSRPLVPVSTDPDAPEALTPFHFLIGTSSLEPSPGKFEESDLCRRSNWKKAQYLTENFWQRWVKEYVPLLAVRRNSGSKQRNLVVGDIVLVADPNLPRNTWPMGRITEVHPGQDGNVRVVDVKTKAGLFRRPTRRLVLLPTETLSGDAGNH